MHHPSRPPADTRVGNVIQTETGVLHGLLHRQGVGGGVTHEAQDLAVDQLFEVQVDGARDLAAQPHVRIGLVEANAGAPGAQVAGDGLFVIAQAGNDTQASDHDATHADVLQKLSVEVNRPTRKPSAL